MCVSRLLVGPEVLGIAWLVTWGLVPCAYLSVSSPLPIQTIVTGLGPP